MEVQTNQSVLRRINHIYLTLVGCCCDHICMNKLVQHLYLNFKATKTHTKQQHSHTHLSLVTLSSPANVSCLIWSVYQYSLSGLSENIVPDQCIQPQALRCSINSFTQPFKSVDADRFRVTQCISDGWFYDLSVNKKNPVYSVAN